MSDLKRNVRDAEDDMKEAWRKSDGDESLGDKLANAGDRIKHGAENVGDEVSDAMNDASRKAEYERGRADQADMDR